MPDLPLGTQSNPGREPHAGIARLVNIYAEAVGDGGKVVAPLYPDAGLTAFSTFENGGATRAMLGVGSEVLVVSNRALYRVDGSGNATLVGGIASDGFVSMAQNGRASGTQVGIVCDGLYYIYAAGTLTQINDPDLQPPNSLCYVGGYFVYTCPSGRVYVSEIEDGTAIDGLDFATAQRQPDGLLRGVARGNEAVLFGPQSMEIWQLSDNPDFPFWPAQTLYLGAVGAAAITEATVLAGGVVTETIVWVATDSSGKYAGVCMLDGFTARKISSLAVDRAIQAEAERDPNAIIATTWIDRGHSFVAISGSTFTWQYDASINLWHERESVGRNGRWRVSHCATLGARTIAGDAQLGALYVVDPDAEDEAGDELVCTIQTPSLEQYPARIEVNDIWLDVVPGVGLATGGTQDVDPQVMMQWSPDGKSWSGQLVRSLGRQGRTGTRVRWTRLGTQGGTGRTYRFRTSANVIRGVLSATWNGKVLPP